MADSIALRRVIDALLPISDMPPTEFDRNESLIARETSHDRNDHQNLLAASGFRARPPSERLAQ